MLVTEPMEAPRLLDVVREAVLGGVNAVQLRDRAAAPEDVALMAATLCALLPKTCIIVNGPLIDRTLPDICGMHLPEHGIRVEEARRLTRPGSVVGRSVHSVQAARLAAAEGADYLIAGTIFASGSHPDTLPAGLDYLRSVCRAVEIPVIAIGGITEANALDCVRAGAAGVAVLSGILQAEDPRAAAARYWKELKTVSGERYGANS
jgi:thiamine-phosphate diphosphorylase